MNDLVIGIGELLIINGLLLIRIFYRDPYLDMGINTTVTSLMITEKYSHNRMLISVFTNKYKFVHRLFFSNLY